MYWLNDLSEYKHCWNKVFCLDSTKVNDVVLIYSLSWRNVLVHLTACLFPITGTYLAVCQLLYDNNQVSSSIKAAHVCFNLSSFFQFCQFPCTAPTQCKEPISKSVAKKFSCFFSPLSLILQYSNEEDLHFMFKS